jgi:hypothetical protein
MQTTDHIRPFFWLPDDLRKDAMAQEVEAVVNQCWVNLAKKKNGGYEPVPLARGFHTDEVTGKRVWSDGKEVKVMVVGPVKVPVGHQMYKEGSGAFVLRNKDHSFLRFKRLEATSVQSLTLPDHVAAELARKGKLNVVEWDTDEGRRAFESSLNPEPISVEETQRQEHLIETRGKARKIEVPY